MEKKVWPYILPLPLTEQYTLFSSVFASKVSVKILEISSSGRRMYQKDLIEELNEYSNKTVILKLKKLVESGILSEGVEKKIIKSKTYWVKWYELTFIGKWFSLLLRPPNQIPGDEAKNILEDLFKLYIINAIHLCKKYKINPSIFRKAFDKALKESDISK